MKPPIQAWGCSARVPLPSERGSLPQRTWPNSLPFPPRTFCCQPQGAPAFQSWGIQGPGGWNFKVLSNLTSAQFQVQWSRAPNLTLGPGPSTQALNCAQSKWQVKCPPKKTFFLLGFLPLVAFLSKIKPKWFSPHLCPKLTILLTVCPWYL